MIYGLLMILFAAVGWVHGAFSMWRVCCRDQADLIQRVAELEAAIWEDDPDPDPGDEAPVVVPFRGRVA